MRDRQIYAMLGTVLASLAPLRGATGVEYALRYQPTQEGRNTAPTIWMFKVGEAARGTAQRTQRPSNTPKLMTRTESQSMETTLQFTVTKPLDLSANGLSHGDVLKIVRACAQSDDFIKALIPYGASVLRVPMIRTPNVINDLGQWEENPSFDLVVKHTDTFTDTQPGISSVEFDVYRI